MLAPCFVGVALNRDCAGSVPTTAVIMAQSVGNLPQLEYLPPGLRIEKDKTPVGWTHVVLKSVPRITSGDTGTLPASALKTATLFRSVILASVKPVDVEEKEFELARIGVGTCIPRPDEDYDVVVSADRLDALGLNLSTVERLVLDEVEAEMKEGRIVMRTPTFAILRAPVTVVVGGNKHVKLYLCYAFCVERTTGRLHVGIWTMRSEPEFQQGPATIYLLARNTNFDCEMDVKAKRILGTVPYSWSFAMRYLPPGRPVRVSPALREMIARCIRHPSRSDPGGLERLLVEAFSAVVEPDMANDKTALPKADTAVRSTAIPPPYRSDH
jgi:hypothetical protein